MAGMWPAYSYFHSFTSHQFHATHDVLFHLDELRKLLGKVRAEGAGSLSPEDMACGRRRQCKLPMERGLSFGCISLETAFQVELLPSFVENRFLMNMSDRLCNVWTLLTNVAFSKQPVGFGRRAWWRRILKL